MNPIVRSTKVEAEVKKAYGQRIYLLRRKVAALSPLLLGKTSAKGKTKLRTIAVSSGAAV